MKDKDDKEHLENLADIEAMSTEKSLFKKCNMEILKCCLGRPVSRVSLTQLQYKQCFTYQQIDMENSYLLVNQMSLYLRYRKVHKVLLNEIEKYFQSYRYIFACVSFEIKASESLTNKALLRFRLRIDSKCDKHFIVNPDTGEDLDGLKST